MLDFSSTSRDIIAGMDLSSTKNEDVLNWTEGQAECCGQ